MSTRLTLMFALVFVVGISACAYAEVQDIKVSGDILIRAVSREAFALSDYEWSCGSVANSRARDDFLMSTVRIRLDADLTDNVAATVRLLNERVWGDTIHFDSAAENDDEVLVDLAYITLREFLYSPLTLNVGRQPLRFGNALIVGDPDTNIMATYWTGVTATSYIMPAPDLSARKAFDAIRATLDYSPWILDVIYSVIDENDPSVSDDTTLAGVNARYDFADNRNSIAELYYFAKELRATNATKTQKNNKVYTVGVRAQSEPIQNLVLNAEVAHQHGSYVYNAVLYPNDMGRGPAGTKVDRDAWAAQVGGNYLFADVQYTPGVSLWYTYLSGDKAAASNTSSGDYEAWDPMFEDQGGETIYNALLGASNCHMINLAGSLRPREDIMASLSWSHIRLAEDYINGSTIIPTGIFGTAGHTMTDKAHLADEIDLVVLYDYTEDVQLGLNAGVFMPGDAFHEDCDRNAYQLIGSMRVTF